MLEEPRRPWLDAGELKNKFHALTALHHPDVAGAAGDFSALNAAYQALREPATRLRHLLELEWPAGLAGGQDAPPGIADLFMKMGSLQHALHAFRKKQQAASIPLAHAVLAPERLGLVHAFEEWLAVLNAKEAGLLEELRLLDAGWEAEKPMNRLAALYQGFSYLSKWTGQVREGLFILKS